VILIRVLVFRYARANAINALRRRCGNSVPLRSDRGSCVLACCCLTPQYKKVACVVSTDQGPVVQSALLRGELVRLRRESQLTQEQVAADLEWSPSKLIRVEGGRSSITRVDLDALLSRYGVTSDSARERLQLLNRGARERGWWDKYRDDVAPTYLNYVGFEAGAAFIRQFQFAFLPGQLQTAEYAEAVTVNSVDAVRVAALVGLRLQRQSELAQRDPRPRQYYILDEAVIRRHVGITRSPDIMPAQLRLIADRAEQDELVTVRVLPFAVGAHRGLYGPFTLLEFDGGLPDLLYIDAGRGEFASLLLGDDPRVAEHQDDFQLMLEDALSAERSVSLIRSVADEMS
jgi:transcriptional regulator with XRE-family HTH domain